MGELYHYGRALLMTRVGEPPQPGNNLILIGEDVVEDGWTVGRHRRRARSHSQGDAGLCTLDMIGTVQIFRHPIFWIGRFVRSDDDPVAQREVLEAVGLEQRVDCHESALRTTLQWSLIPGC